MLPLLFAFSLGTNQEGTHLASTRGQVFPTANRKKVSGINKAPECTDDLPAL